MICENLLIVHGRIYVGAYAIHLHLSESESDLFLVIRFSSKHIRGCAFVSGCLEHLKS